ncbi:MAG: carboxypeptidase-like regulatory domain-containing protein [Acidobacteriota bacterium]|nr:carboxypeptidase-like regulatory domain-containing protein [Acidobacteriota bacterium]
MEAAEYEGAVTHRRPVGPSRSGRRFLRVALIVLLLGAAPVLAVGGAPRGRVLRGVAVDPAGHRLAGVEIVLTSERAGTRTDSGPLTVRSDAKGRFALAGLTPGSYRIVAVKGGYSVLVGKVDTLVRDFLEIILQPSGPPAPPGSRPRGSAWALRLPQRDRLETRGAAAASAAGDGTAGAEPARSPLLFEWQRAWTDDGSGSAQGMVAALSGEVPIEDFGRFAVSFRRRAVGEAGGLRDTGDVVVASWRPEPGVGTGIPTIEVTTLGRKRRSLPDGAASGGGFGQRQLGLRADWSVLRPGRLVEASVEAGLARGSEDYGGGPGEDEALESEFSARRLAARVSVRSGWARDHELEGQLEVVRAAGGVADDPLGRPAAVVPFADRSGGGSLETLHGDTLDLRLADAWTPASRWELASRWRVMQVGGSRSALRMAASVGATYRPAPGWELAGEVGVARGERQPEGQSWRLALSHHRGPWTLSLEGSETRGLPAWEETPSAGPPTPLLLTERSAHLRRTRARADWVGPRGWPSVAFQAERIDASGRLAAGWSGAFPLAAVVDDADACGESLQVLVDSPATGTFVSIGWARVEDGASGVLLEGAAAWQRRAFRLRQRLPAGDRTWAWHLMVNVEEGAFIDPPADSDLPKGRLALVDQRRISGGVAVAF